ncbi:MFS transporter [Sulfitobacter sp. SK011]|uniref:MFS transporter n=1 Tax=Sulfitobacter sp. SK011 TaxID=1389004 RepID=UPI000E0C2404|nr:MFS transporter [Sulfitobacter sp. SK011]AXI41328.1 MFS transporter [Sulfitobacter sp. SK011]
MPENEVVMSEHAAAASEKPDEYVPWREFLTSGYTASLALVSLGVWLHAADSLVVATMLPAMIADIGGAAFVSWTVSIYEIGSIVAGAASALITMRYGLHGPMSIAAFLFGAGCAASAISPNMGLLLIGRALQGFGGGGLVAMCFVALGVLFPRRYAARALAVVSAFWGMSAFLGPLIGGLFVEYANWRLGFWFFATLAFMLSAWIALRQETATLEQGKTDTRFPLSRLALLCFAVVLISYGGVRVEALRTSGLIGAGVLCLIWFFRRDGLAGPDRLLPHAPLDPRHATGATLLMLMMLPMATVAITAYGPLLMTVVHGTSALTAGYVVACSSIGWTLAAVSVSGSPERFDRIWIAIGMAVTTLSIAGFVYALPAGPVWLIAVCALAEGGGFGLAYTFILRRITAVAPKEDMQRITGAIPTMQRIGYALGAAYIGIIANASGFLSIQTPDDAGNVARILFLACLPLALVGLVAMLGLVRRHPHDASL